jgi:SAM-dependent methyltransferase
MDGVRLVGTDLFADMLERGRETIREAGVEPRIELLQQDVHAMDIADAFADIVTSRSTIHHWANPPRAFTEIYRVLKPGGIALIIDVRRDPAPEAIDEFNRQRALAGIGPSNLDEKFTPVEVEAFVREAGLEAHAVVRTPRRGLAALAYVVEIRKPAAA